MWRWMVCFSLSGTLACGPGKGDPRWITDDSAIVRCTVSGHDKMPSLLMDLPVPPVSTGLYARVLDPMALDALGYQRDTVVCATLEAPERFVIEHATLTLGELLRAHDDVSRDVLGKHGVCGCELARVLGAKTMLHGCASVPTQPACLLDNASLLDVSERMTPLTQAIAATVVPRVHWRIAGVTDRPGWFASNLAALLPRHPGGSTVYLRDRDEPRGDNRELLRKLLDQDGVVAVVHQDRGHALLLVREFGASLILDHFAYPAMTSWREPLWPYLDNAGTSALVASLQMPALARELLLDGSEGYMLELDRGALERFDVALTVASSLATRPYLAAREERVDPPQYLDRIAFQVPFDTDGNTLNAVASLSEAGRMWASGLDPDRVVDPELDALGLASTSSVFAPGSADVPAFLLRGRDLDLLFSGLHGLPKVFRALEMVKPSSLSGTVSHWRMAIPSGPIVPHLPTRAGLRALRERLSKVPHRLEMRLENDRTRLEAVLSP